MAKLTVKLNRDGVKELMRSSEMMAICKEHAEAAQRTLGDGYEVSTYKGKTRANASIAAVSAEARAEVYNNNSILRALGGG